MALWFGPFDPTHGGELSLASHASKTRPDRQLAFKTKVGTEAFGQLHSWHVAGFSPFRSESDESLP